MSGKLAKLVIQSFVDRGFTKKAEDFQFTAPINPESFTKNYKINLDTQTGHGNDGTNPRYKSTAPEELKLEFILDGTNTMLGYVEELRTMPVHDQLQKFLKTVYDVSGKIHRPRFLIVFYGSEVNFRCVLSNLDINHTLFDKDGNPLRVKLSATFLRYKTKEEIIEEKKLSSPDLTHHRKVRAGDRLDLMTHDIYNDATYFLQVARVNNLSTVRRIRPGTDLYFPPFDKNEA